VPCRTTRNTGETIQTWVSQPPLGSAVRCLPSSFYWRQREGTADNLINIDMFCSLTCCILASFAIHCPLQWAHLAPARAVGHPRSSRVWLLEPKAGSVMGQLGDLGLVFRGDKKMREAVFGPSVSVLRSCFQAHTLALGPCLCCVSSEYL